MRIEDIPVVGIGPGSQPPEADGQRLEYIDLPKGISTYEAPVLPEPKEVAGLDGARDTMRWLRGALDQAARGSGPLLADLSALDAANRDLVNQILGEGEVSVVLDGKLKARTQESVLPGVWRTLYLDDNDAVRCDLLEVGAITHLVGLGGDGRAPLDLGIDATQADLSNALPLLTELEARRAAYRPGDDAYVINLTLLPLTEEEVAFLDERLGRGPVDILSRAYGKCQIISTMAANVWWVRYYNSMGTPILNTIEVIDIPQVACAAPEDLADSAKRLDEILVHYWQDDA